MEPKASLISYRSMSSLVSPARRSKVLYHQHSRREGHADWY
jgi:hypothetical protein